MSVTAWTLSPEHLTPVGHDLSRPECVLAEPDGTLWISDDRGGVTRRDPDGRQTRLGALPGLPNGLAMTRQGDLLVANIGDGRLYRLRRDGSHEVLLDAIDGRPLGQVNFVFLDSRERLWISVSARDLSYNPITALLGYPARGYIILRDERGPRVVADDLTYTNEVRLDAAEQYLYAAETMAARIIRFPVRPDGSLGPRETVGPDPLGFAAFVDGFAFDAEGHLWVTTLMRNGIVLIDPDGRARTLVEEPQIEALERAVAAVRAGRFQPADFEACRGRILQFPTSIAFGGPDLRTVYVGSLTSDRLLTFRSPVPGLPLHHWR